MHNLTRRAAVLGLFATGLCFAFLALAQQWLPLAEDGLHDPESPAIEILQQPSEALSLLPADTVGNLVKWVEALDAGIIRPRANLADDAPVRVLDQDVVLRDTGAMPMVLFPHKPHTEWLDCSNCHSKIFAMTAGKTPVNMFAILQGRFCGRCHGAVSFPLTECKRCHNVPRNR